MSLCIPWFFLAVVVEPGRPERFGWLWPLQVSVLSAVITHLHVMPTSAVARVIVAGLKTLLIVVLVATPLWLRGVSWLQTGWGGVDAEEIEVVRYVARQLRHEGRDTAAIGYQMFTLADHPARWNVIDPRYKVGAELDLIFKHQHDISNTTRCAEGVSPDDEYRIVQTEPRDSGRRAGISSMPGWATFSISSSGSTCTRCSGVNHGPISTGDSKDTTLGSPSRLRAGVHHSGRCPYPPTPPGGRRRAADSRAAAEKMPRVMRAAASLARAS
jgi:hypothetical protein